MDHAFLVDGYSYVCDAFLPFVGKENKVSCFDLLNAVDDTSLLRLLGGIAGKRLAKEAHQHLREARAIHAHRVLSAP